MVRQKHRILIVDDEQVICDLLRDELHDQGYLCSTALNGNEALTALLAEDFDVALVDIRLPDMSGLELLGRMHSYNYNIAVIIITVINDVRTVVEAMKLGAADYIVKPFELHDVNTSILTALNGNNQLAPPGHVELPSTSLDEQEIKRYTKRPLNRMDAIALGLEVKLGLSDDYSKRVIERAINIAWHFGIPENEIYEWANERARLDAENKQIIGSLLKKLERNPLAQKMIVRNIIGMTEMHPHSPNLDEF